MPDQYVNAAGHGITLASGRPLAPGEHGPVTLVSDDDGKPVLLNGEQVIDAHDQALIDERHLVRRDPAGAVPDDEDLHGWLDQTSVDDILTAAADTPEDAARIHAAEAARSKPRKTLLEALAPTDPEPNALPEETAS